MRGLVLYVLVDESNTTTIRRSVFFRIKIIVFVLKKYKKIFKKLVKRQFKQGKVVEEDEPIMVRKGRE